MRALLLCILALALWAGPGAGQQSEAALAAAVPSSAPNEDLLPFFYDFYTFRGTEGRTRVVAALAVRAQDLEPKRIRGEQVYRFDVSFVLADTALLAVYRSDDSVFVAGHRPLPDDHLLFTQVVVEAPPLAKTIQRVVVTDPNRVGYGQLYHSPFPVPDYRGSELMLSDIALGRPGDGGSPAVEDASVAILPIGRYPESSFDIYYEIYNLPEAHRYTTEIAVEPVGARGRATTREPVRFRFTGDSRLSAGGAVRELRRLTGWLEPGRYRLTVTVTDEPTGERATKSRVFEVREWGTDATLVVARPR